MELLIQVQEGFVNQIDTNQEVLSLIKYLAGGYATLSILTIWWIINAIFKLKDDQSKLRTDLIRNQDKDESRDLFNKELKKSLADLMSRVNALDKKVDRVLAMEEGRKTGN